MTKMEKVMRGLECCMSDGSECYEPSNGKCPYYKDDVSASVCTDDLFYDIYDLLKAQEPHILTKNDFNNNPNVDESGYLPAYCEKIDRPIGWMAIHKGYIGARKDIRYWTGKPTDEQREAVEWK